MTRTTPSPPRTEQRVVRCSGTADFLAALPQLVGFTASESVFVVLFDGSRAESALRFDLPIGEGPRDTAPLLDLICGALTQLGELGASPGIVIHCEQRFAEAGGPPRARLARRLQSRLRRCGIRPRELCCLAPDGWGAYADPHLPARGRPLREIEQSPIALGARMRGTAIPDLSTIGLIAAASPECATATELALTELTLGERSHPASPHERVSAASAAAEAVLRVGAEEPAPGLCAQLALAASDPGRWLVIALTLLTDAEFVVRLADTPGFHRFTDIPVDHPSAPFSRTPPSGGEGADGSSPHRASATTPRRVSGREASAPEAAQPQPPQPQPPQPQLPSPSQPSSLSIRSILLAVAHDDIDRDRLRRAAKALEAATRPVPDRLRPGLLALAAWARWMTGMSSVAGRHVDAALRLEPAHELARMLEDLVATGPVTTLPRLGVSHK